MAHSHQPETTALSQNDTQFIEDAARYLESPALLMEIANAIGKPLEIVFKGLDKIAPVDRVVEAALLSALNVAIATLGNKLDTAGDGSSDIDIAKAGTVTDWWHRLSVMTTGSIGGLFGLAGLAVELPITTTIMLRSIAATAKDFGENLHDAEVRLQCLAVFAFGGSSHTDDALESSYLSARASLQMVLQETANLVSRVTAEELAAMIQKGTAPVVVAFVARIASMFDVAVAEKVVAQSIPIIGTVGGAAINVVFMRHFNRVARFHFGIRNLESKYGRERIQAIFRATVLAIKQKQQSKVTCG